MKKPKHPAFALLWLIMIPVQIILDVVLVFLGALGDMSIANPEAYGHPAPGLVIVAVILAAIFTIIIPVISVVITIVRYSVLNKRYKRINAN